MSPLPRIVTGTKLIGIHGHAGAGKDTVCNFIGENYPNTYKESFADPLKQACAEMYGISLNAFYDTELKETPISPWNRSPRELAQFFGTEMVRNTLGALFLDIGESFWIHRLTYQINNLTKEQQGYNADDTVIIPDVRFQDEYDWVIENGGIIIHLTRPGHSGKVGIPGHSSEAGINLHAKEVTYHVTNTSSLEFLYGQVKSVLDRSNIYHHVYRNL